MAVDPELLNILVCPECKTTVHLVKQDTALKCERCHRVYPIKDDIPVMLVDEATVERQCNREYMELILEKLQDYDVVVSMACGAGAQLLAAQGYPKEMIEDMGGAGTRTIKMRGGMGLLGVLGKYASLRDAYASIDKAIELNGVAVDFNLKSFAWGRRAAADLEQVRRLLQAGRPN